MDTIKNIDNKEKLLIEDFDKPTTPSKKPPLLVLSNVSFLNKMLFFWVFLVLKVSYFVYFLSYRP